MPAEPEALFVREEETWRPGELARGPWSAGALHGGPVAAALAGLAEALPQPEPMQPARMTVELLRPESALFDEDGRLGRSLQSLLLERTGSAASAAS